MRIALKKLRYVVEAAQPVLGLSGKHQADEMHAFQQLMGDSRDVEMLSLPRSDHHQQWKDYRDHDRQKTITFPDDHRIQAFVMTVRNRAFASAVRW
jgi:CHAD domain-containing protein